MDSSIELMVTVMTASLFAWDLGAFHLRINGTEKTENRHIMESWHLKQLLSIAALTAVFTAIALNIEFKLDFLRIVGLVLALAICLGSFLLFSVQQDPGLTDRKTIINRAVHPEDRWENIPPIDS